MPQNWYGNMGPFEPVSLKGNARVNAVPMFVDKLPLTLGGIAGEDIPFGRVVSVNPADNRRMFYLGKPEGYVVKGIAMMDPTIMRVDPVMQNYYFQTRPMTVTTFGILDILEYDLDKDAPYEGAKVGFNATTGEIQFGDNVDNQLNASIYETLDPNGAKVFFGFPMDYAAMNSDTRNSETLTQLDTPSIKVEDGVFTIENLSDLKGAAVYYTLDGTDPDWGSLKYTNGYFTGSNEGVAVDAGTTIKARAMKEGYLPSEVASATA